MSERLIDKVAEAETPADALRAVRDWLEQHGAPTAAMGIHREITDRAVDWRGERGFKAHEAALEAEYEKGYEEGQCAGSRMDFDEGYDEGYEAGRQSALKEVA